MEQFTRSVPVSLPEEILGKLVSLSLKGFLEVILIISVAIFVYKIVYAFGEKLAKRHPVKSENYRNFQTKFRLYLAFFKVLIILLTVFVVLQTLKVNLAPLVAFISLLFVGLILALKDTIKDLVSGLFGLSNNRLRLGDMVTIDGFYGEVEDASWKNVLLRDVDGSVHVIKFSSINHVTNHTMNHGSLILKIGVHYKSNLSEVNKSLQNVYLQLKTIFLDKIYSPIEIEGVDELRNSDVVFIAKLKIDPHYRLEIKRKFHELILLEFEKNDIQIPYPYQNIIIEHDSRK